jgi:hypothetical protein
MRALLVLPVILAATWAHASDSARVSDSGDWEGISPNQKHFAALAVRLDQDMIWRKDIGIGILEVVEPYASSGKITNDEDTPQYGDYYCFSLGDRAGVRAQWSPDSRYLVITTASLGGHSPWHFNTYLYCSEDHTLRYMDDLVGPVTSPTFTFVGPHSVRLGVGFGTDEVDVDHPKQIEVDLDQESREMNRQHLLAKGNLSGG